MRAHSVRRRECQPGGKRRVARRLRAAILPVLRGGRHFACGAGRRHFACGAGRPPFCVRRWHRPLARAEGGALPPLQRRG